MERAERSLEADDRTWRVEEAWRAESGLALAYFLPLEDGGEVRPDDREDRRAVLEADETLGELSADALRDRLGEATPLTATERRFRAPDGRSWLVQSVGPVWSEGTASGLTGLLFTALEGPAERARTAGGHAGEMSDGELERRWRRAVGEAGIDDEEASATAGAAADTAG